jgi:hypothetical protein
LRSWHEPGSFGKKLLLEIATCRKIIKKKNKLSAISRFIFSDFPNAFFPESRNRLSSGGVQQCIDGFFMCFGVIHKRAYFIALQIGNSFMQRFRQRQMDV